MLRGLTVLAASEVGGAVRRKVGAVGFYAAATFFLIAAGGYGLSALHDWLSLTYTPMMASLMIAGGLLVMAIILMVIGMMWGQRKAEKSQTLASAALLAAPLAASTVSRLNLGTITAVGAIAAGALLGRKIAKG